MPVAPRRVSGGSSLNRNLLAGQVEPQPSEVMARKTRPAGAIRGGAAGFDSVMKPGKGREQRWNRLSACRLSRPATTGAGACQPSYSVAPRESLLCNPQGVKNTCPVNSGAKVISTPPNKFFVLGIP